MADQGEAALQLGEHLPLRAALKNLGDEMAAFVQHNMPQTNPGSLTPQDAYDVAAYVHGKPHSRFELKEHR